MAETKTINYAAMHKYKPTSSAEKEVDGKYVTWGQNNLYPQYLRGLIENCPSLNSIINGLTDYALGGGVRFTNDPMLMLGGENATGDTLEDVFAKCVYDYLSTGNCFIQVNYNEIGEVAEVYHLLADKARLSKGGTKIYVAEDWRRGASNFTVFNSFGSKSGDSIEVLHCKNKYIPSIYGRPIFGSAFKNIETDVEIHTRNFSTIKNDFVGSMMFTYPNADLTEDQKDAIVNGIKDNFSGSHNAGNIMFNFGSDVKVERLQAEQISAQYVTLNKTNTEAIYASMRVIPQLFGLMTAATGFSQQEFAEAFNIMNVTLIRPIQQEYTRFWERILGRGTIEIQPFNLSTLTQNV